MNELEKSMKHALSQLDKIETSPFSSSGFKQFKYKISEFVYNLYYESHKVSRTNQSDLISGGHVDIGSMKLMRTRASKNTNLLNSLGGLLLGATISNVFAMVSYGVTFSLIGILLTIISGMIGAFILGYYLLND